MPQTAFPIQDKRTPFFHRLGEIVGRLFTAPAPVLTASDLGRMGNAAQKAARQSKMDAKHVADVLRVTRDYGFAPYATPPVKIGVGL